MTDAAKILKIFAFGVEIHLQGIVLLQQEGQFSLDVLISKFEWAQGSYLLSLPVSNF